MKFDITWWEVDDRYAGKSRPQTLEFDTDDWTNNEEEWNELSEDEKKELIEEAVQEEFYQTISFYIKPTPNKGFR